MLPRVICLLSCGFISNSVEKCQHTADHSVLDVAVGWWVNVYGPYSIRNENLTIIIVIVVK